MVHIARRSGRLIAPAGLALGLGLGLAGCGGGGHAQAISWAGKPALVRPAELPHDRILIGRIRNGTDRQLRLVAAAARVVDAKGHALESTVRFASAYGHGLYSYDQQPKEGDPEFEKVRLGEVAVVPPHQTAPLTLSWRLRSGTGAPVRVVIGRLALALPY